MATKIIKMALVATLLAGGCALAVWLNRPEPDPWAGVPAGQPHPRIGGRVHLDDRTFIDLPPLAVTPRHVEGPAHWREVLRAVRDDALPSLLGPPDQQVAGPGGTTSRAWHSWCPAADQPTEWVAHLWLESRDGAVVAVHLVGGGGVRLDEPQSLPPPAPVPAEVPLPR